MSSPRTDALPPPPYSDLSIAEQLSALPPQSDDYAVRFIDLLLNAGIASGVSDIHLQPSRDGLDVRWRIDGVMHPIGIYANGGKSDPIARMKVLAHLLTYRHDVPQEGRVRDQAAGIDIRVSTLPTIRGERAVVRLFVAANHPWQLTELGLPNDLLHRWKSRLRETSGALIVSGPAGSGKTTTGYASLRHIVADSQRGRSIVSMEDPVEVELEGVAQAQVNVNADFTLTTGLRSLVRQDPEVIYLGEMRGPDSATIAFQAALTGQLMLTTFHAQSAAATICRLYDMGIEPYVLRSTLGGILNQRLVRRLCHCKVAIDNARDLAGWQPSTAWKAVGCDDCGQTGFGGRILLAELLDRSMETHRDWIDGRSDAQSIESMAIQHGMVTLREQAISAIAAGSTSPQEARRVLGFGPQTDR